MQFFTVKGMTCGHCVRAVTQVIKSDDPAAEVQVDLASSRVSVQSPLPSARIIELIAEEGYQAQLA